jgi:hypothetical protein
MKRTKRYNGEDESVTSSDDSKDYGGSSGSGDYAPEPAKPANFKEAFAAARKSGDSIFEFNGKKYTTELASSKPATTGAKRGDSDIKPIPLSKATKEDFAEYATRKTEPTSSTTKKETYRDLSGKVQTKKSESEKDAENAARRESAMSGLRGIGSSIGNMLSKAKQNYESTRPVSRQVQKEREAAAARGNLAKGGKVSSASSRADGIAMRGKTRGKYC